MRSLLLATAALLALSTASHAIVITNLGVNPNSSQGDFSTAPGGGAFANEFTFQLVGGPMFITAASATNVFPGGSATSDFITDFTAFIRAQLGGAPAPGDPIVLGPQVAAPCSFAPTTCQGLGGTALVNPGNYYLQFTGIGGGTSGYGGNLSVFATSVPPVPGPIVGAGIPGLIAALFGMIGLRTYRRRRSA
jgi:hypothetical protein